MLKCIFCFFNPQAPGAESAAHFVVDGQSVCKQHVRLARDTNNFNAAYTKMIQDSGKTINVRVVDAA